MEFKLNNDTIDILKTISEKTGLDCDTVFSALCGNTAAWAGFLANNTEMRANIDMQLKSMGNKAMINIANEQRKVMNALLSMSNQMSKTNP